MKRLIPFYTFSRRNIPYQLMQVLEKPGGKVATGIKVGGELRQNDDQFLPEYLGGGVAMPLGGEEGGVQRFLTSLGLPFEQPFDVIDPRSATRTGERLLSQFNPLLKAPLEGISGKQFYSGRELDAENLYSPTGTGSVFLDQLLMNSPLARVASTAKTITDPRKGAGAKALNLLSGIKVSDVNMDQQRDLVAKDILRDVLGDTDGVRSLERLYVPEENIPSLSEEEKMLMRLYRTQEQRAKKKAAERKAQSK